MYSNESISYLMNRIGWSKPLDPNSAIVIDNENDIAVSGRRVSSFHQLASVENIYAAISLPQMAMIDFNAFLKELRSEAVNDIITAIMDQSDLYDQAVDYSDTLMSKARLFDDAIGYSIAIKCLELFISSGRSNLMERNAKLSFQTLKVELEGARNDNGHFIAKGIVYKKERAIQKAQRIIFPDPVVVIGDSIW